MHVTDEQVKSVVTDRLQSEMQASIKSEVRSAVSASPVAPLQPLPGLGRSIERLRSQPLEQRVEGRMGNLGYDLDADELLTRAKKVLSEAGVKEEDFDFMYVEREPGSMASFLAKTPALLRAAIIRVQSLKRSMPDNPDKVVWMGVARTREENAENKRIHRLHGFVVAIEQTRPEPEQGRVEEDIGGRSVKVNGHIAAILPYNGMLRLTNWARNRWSGPECEELVDLASF